MSIIYFREGDHIYTSNKGVQYESVSGLWKPYTKQFDAHSVSVKKAFKDLDLENYNACKKTLSYDHPDLINLLRESTELPLSKIDSQAKEFRDTWTAKAQTGTDFHALEEGKDLAKGFRINPFTDKKSDVVKWEVEEGHDNQSCPGKLFDTPDGYIPELLVRCDESQVAGQLDQCFIETIDGVRYIDIDDWKTDAEILMKPAFFNRSAGGYQTLAYPFNHIYETNHWKYAMKISTYARILEKEGFVVRNLAFTHVVIDEDLEILESKRYILPYKRFEANLALEMRASNL